MCFKWEFHFHLTCLSLSNKLPKIQNSSFSVIIQSRTTWNIRHPGPRKISKTWYQFLKCFKMQNQLDWSNQSSNFVIPQKTTHTHIQDNRTLHQMNTTSVGKI